MVQKILPFSKEKFFFINIQLVWSLALPEEKAFLVLGELFFF